jgi:AraC-like DNA-binding protein
MGRKIDRWLLAAILMDRNSLYDCRILLKFAAGNRAMQPWFETVTIPPDRSWLLFDRQLAEFPFNWHYHPEFELTLTVNSEGMRFVGDHVERYGDGDLVLLGPNLPHAWQSHAPVDAGSLHRAIVCWFTRDWIEALLRLMPELAPVALLLSEARRGLEFGADTIALLRPRMLRLGALQPAEQLLELQSILLLLSAARDRRPLASGEISIGDLPRDRARMQRILTWLHTSYDKPVQLAPLCDIAHLTESQLQRVFKRSTRMSISQYVTQLRIGRACQLLVQTDSNMSRIAAECGFADSAHFARKFREAKGVTPTRYRMDLFASRRRWEEGNETASAKSSLEQFSGPEVRPANFFSGLEANAIDNRGCLFRPGTDPISTSAEPAT